MSGPDIRDILQISAPLEPTVRRLKAATEKRPEGFSRELYSLIGGAPPVAFVQPTYKAKYNVKKKAVPWYSGQTEVCYSLREEGRVYQSFENPARADDLVLKHWIHASTPEQDTDYLFAKYNRVIDVVEYTEEEYERHLTGKPIYIYIYMLPTATATAYS
ncbi:hypothetical protein BDF14DRAFT_1840015 [Spinellus fusiger]|nr:hypothetical protein BDF14DRAFT_1840015 [Spinellus fusiger]